MAAPLIFDTAPRAPGPADVGALSPDQRAAAEKIAREFEGMVLGQMLAPLFSEMDAEGLGGGGAGERMFRPMLVERYAEGMAQAGGLGIADAVLRELVRMQGADDGAGR